jgi:hypothetical protein
MQNDQKGSRLSRWLSAGRYSFGLREAIIVSIIGIAITLAAAVHYGT